MTFMDANEAQEYAALMRMAHAIVHPDGELEDRQAEDFMEWAQERNLEASIGRHLDPHGHVEWGLEIKTGRGTLSAQMNSAGDWRRVVEDDLGIA